jgi:hypothetical protein
MIIGAGVGALGSAAMGKSPFTGALLGGTLGGLGGAGGLFGGAAEGATAGTIGTNGLIGGANLTGAGVASGAATGATGGLGSFLSSIKGVETAPVSFGTGGYASGITSGLSPAVGLEGQSLEQALGYTIPKQNLANIVSPENIAKSGFPTFEQSGFNNLTTGANVSAPYSADALANNPLMSQQLANNAGQTTSLMSDARNYLSNLPSSIGNSISNMSTMDKVGLGLKGYEAANPPQIPVDTSAQTSIKQGNPNMVYAPNWNTNASSNLSNVPPNPLPQQDNKKGLMGLLQARIPLTDEEIAQYQRLNQRY